VGKLTGIQWCDDTINPSSGCDGCELWVPGRGGPCYAGNLHETRLHPAMPELYAADFSGEVRLIPGRMEKAARCMDLAGQPRPARKGSAAKPWLDGLRRKIFVGDMADVFSRAVPFGYLQREVVEVAASAAGSRHDWLMLTKQPQRAVQFATWLAAGGIAWPANLWLGTSVTSQTTLSRVDHLLQVPARVKFLSIEPQVEQIELPDRYLGIRTEGQYLNIVECGRPIWSQSLQWVIIGGESNQGPGRWARPFNVNWARELLAQCREANVPAFIKQLGSRPYCRPIFLDRTESLRPRADGYIDEWLVELRDNHGGDWEEWDSDLRVREFPAEVGIEAMAGKEA
jgi:protein gp37